MDEEEKIIEGEWNRLGKAFENAYINWKRFVPTSISFAARKRKRRKRRSSSASSSEEETRVAPRGYEWPDNEGKPKYDGEPKDEWFPQIHDPYCFADEYWDDDREEEDLQDYDEEVLKTCRYWKKVQILDPHNQALLKGLKEKGRPESKLGIKNGKRMKRDFIMTKTIYRDM